MNKLKAVREALLDVLGSLVAAHSLLSRSPKTAAPSNKMFDQMLKDYKASIKRGREALALLDSGGEGEPVRYPIWPLWAPPPPTKEFLKSLPPDQSELARLREENQQLVREWNALAASIGSDRTHLVVERTAAIARAERAEALQAKGGVVEALHRALETMHRYKRAGYGDDVFMDDLCQSIRVAEVALTAQPEPKPVSECATEGCDNPASVHFVRGGVGSFYCHACYLKVQALSHKGMEGS